MSDSESSSKLPLILGGGCVLLVVCSGCCGLFSALTLPAMLAYQDASMYDGDYGDYGDQDFELVLQRMELSLNVDMIKLSQDLYQMTNDRYLAIDAPVPRAVSALDGQQIAWPSGTAFETISFDPYGPVYGTYWVELSADGSDYTVHGQSDLDGDGVPARFTATKTRNATQETPESVY